MGLLAGVVPKASSTGIGRTGGLSIGCSNGRSAAAAATQASARWITTSSLAAAAPALVVTLVRGDGCRSVDTG